jgi:hypothetical protein
MLATRRACLRRPSENFAGVSMNPLHFAGSSARAVDAARSFGLAPLRPWQQAWP